MAATLIWWLIIQLLGLAGLPLAALLFGWLPDRGYAQAKALGLLVAGSGAWLLAMLGLLRFGAPLLAGVALVAGAAGWWAMRQTGLVGFLRARWRMVLFYEALFLAALIFMAVLRATRFGADGFGISPDPHGTERPMDFAFFNAIQRSPQFPPHDPWLSGYSINYYYLGYLLMASMALLSGLPPAVAYNLSLALIFALTALGVAGVVWNLAGLTPRAALAPPPEEAATPGPERPAGVMVAAALAAVLVLLAGNQSAAIQIGLGDERAVTLTAMQTLDAAGQALRGAQTIELPGLVYTGDFGAFDRWERQPPGEAFSSWWTSRSLWDDIPAIAEDGRAVLERRYAITEFPAFSFGLGDMHPHVLSLPYGLLAITLAMATAARACAPRYAAGAAGWAELLLSGLIIGSLYMINSWDLPTYALLFALALLLLHTRLAGGLRALRWSVLGTQLLAVALVSFLLFAPFYLTFRSFAGAEPVTDIPLLRSITAMVGPLLTDRTELHTFVIIFGLFVLPLAWFVVVQPRPAHAPEAEAGIAAHPGTAGGRWTLPALIHAGPAVVVATLVAGLLVNFPLLALLPLGLLALGLALAAPERLGPAIALIGVALGCLIVFGTELFYIRDVFEGWQPRFNTIFKFYYQAWLIWGTLAGYALWWLYARHFTRRRPGAYLLGALVGALLLGALVYPQNTLVRALAHGERTGLDGRNPRQASAAGQASIAWLRTRAPDGAVILEAIDQGDSYDPRGDGAAQVSAASGLPAVLGWPGHQSQWRNGNPAVLAEVNQRLLDVGTIYRTTDVNEARALLQRYNVRYIYVGTAEQLRYPPEGLAKFAGIGRVVFQQDEVTIYEVIE